MSDLGVWLAEQSKSEREYLLKHQPRDFIESGRDFNRYYGWVTDFGFIEAKLKLLGVQPLIEDYDLGRNADVFLSQEQSETLKLIQGAIRKSAHVLEKDKTQLAGHLWGRLMDFERPQIQAIVEQAKQSRNSPCLWSLRANLERSGEGCLRTLSGHTDWVNAVAIAPDGNTAISASWDKTLKIWDTETGTEVRTLTGHTDPVNAVAIAPDGNTAISASWDYSLKIWDTETGTEVRTLTGHTKSVRGVAIAPDGNTAISASWDYSLKIWDTETGRELKTLTAHTDDVNAVAISPNGKTAISASDDNTLKVWDLLSGEEVVSFSGDAQFRCCAILLDGLTVVAGEASGRVHFLRLEGMGDLGDV
jgi:WD40 repeat protein